MMIRAFTISAIAALLVAACTEDPDSLKGNRRGNNGLGDNGDGAGGGDPTQPGNCKEGVAHPGFAQTNFVDDRKPGGIGADRRRVKPYTAIRTEFQRVLGTVPATLVTKAAAFGDTPARWYSEPTAGAISLNTIYNEAFTGCYDTMTDAKYEQAPTPDTATAECTTLQRKAWQRSPTPEEIQACSNFIVGLSSEPAARRRWAHGCASVMTAAGFTTY